MNQAGKSGDLKFISNYIKRRPVTEKHLTCAFTNGNVVTVQYFYYLGYNVMNSIPLSCLMQFCDVLDFVVSSLAPLNLRIPDRSDLAGVVCNGSNEHIFDTLVKAGMPLNSLLHAAAHAGNVSFINKLYGLGVDMGNRDEDGWTALFDACDGYELEAAELLIDLGVDVNAVDNSGDTSLHIACHNDDVDMVKLLLQHHCLPVGNGNDEYPEDVATDEEIKRLVHVEKPLTAPRREGLGRDPEYLWSNEILGSRRAVTRELFAHTEDSDDEDIDALYQKIVRAREQFERENAFRRKY